MKNKSKKRSLQESKKGSLFFQVQFSEPRAGPFHIRKSVAPGCRRARRPRRAGCRCSHKAATVTAHSTVAGSIIESGRYDPKFHSNGSVKYKLAYRTALVRYLRLYGAGWVRRYRNVTFLWWRTQQHRWHGRAQGPGMVPGCTARCFLSHGHASTESSEWPGGPCDRTVKT